MEDIIIDSKPYIMMLRLGSGDLINIIKLRELTLEEYESLRKYIITNYGVVFDESF